MIWNLQALRGFAAVLVVAHHMRDVAAPAEVGPIAIVVGAAGVDIFFVLSGVVIGLAICQPGQSPGGFALRRALRIAPLYWLVTLIVAGLAALGLAPLGHPTGGLARADILMSLAFLPYLRETGLLMPVLGVGWTLNYEGFFYVLAAGCLVLPPGRRLGALVLVLLALVGLGLTLPTEGALARFYTSPLLLEFAAGLGLAGWWRNTRRGTADLTVGLCLAGAGLTLFIWHATWPDFAMLHPWRALVFGLPAVLIVAACLMLERAGLRLVWGPWQALGLASFALYVTHPLALQLALKGAVFMDLDLWPTLALAWTVVLGVAALTFVLVERPLLRWSHRVGETRPQDSAQRPGSTAVPQARIPTRARALPRWSRHRL